MLNGFVPWPADFVDRYRKEGYWRGEKLGDLVRPWAVSDPTRIAVVSDTQRISYFELNRRADRLAGGLQRLGINTHDRVLVQLPNCPQFIELALALFRLGAIPVFALPTHRSSEIAYLCQQSDARAYVLIDQHSGFDYRRMARAVRDSCSPKMHLIVVGDAEECIRFAELDDEPVSFPEVCPQDPAFLLLSGGTVGIPKLIPRTHDDYACQLRCALHAANADSSCVYLAALPVAHNAALGCPGVLGTLQAGGKVVLGSSPNPADAFDLIEREGVTLTTLISPLVVLWLDAAELMQRRFPKLVIEVGGAMLDPALARAVIATLGCSLSHWFGMAEGVHSCTRAVDSLETVVTTQGRALCAGDEMRIVDENERDVPQGSVGQLIARGPCTLRGYFNAAEHNKAAFSADGYLRTGDLARFTPDGHLVIEGRIKNVINRGGEKISVEELETLLLKHPDIRKAAVVPITDAAVGERIGVFIVARQPLSLTQLRQYLVQQGIADFKVPERLQLVDSLPETGMGKIDRAALKRAFHGGAAR